MVDLYSGIDAGGLVRPADEKRGGGEEGEGEGDLCDNEWIAREKFPMSPNDIFGGVFFQVADDEAAREFEGWPEREADRTDQAKNEGRA